MNITSEFISLDTNIFIFGIREESRFPACTELLERIGELHIFLPRQVLRELNHNLSPDEVKELFALWRQYPENIKISWDPTPIELVEKYQQLGCKLGDAMVAAHLEHKKYQNSDLRKSPFPGRNT